MLFKARNPRYDGGWNGEPEELYKRAKFVDADAGIPAATEVSPENGWKTLRQINEEGRARTNPGAASPSYEPGAGGQTSFARRALASVRDAATKSIGEPVIGSNFAGAGLLRFGTSMLVSAAVAGVVEDRVAELTGSKTAGFAAGYAAGAYGAYATESVLFGGVSGSAFVRFSVWTLPLAVHMHIVGNYINGPLERLIALGDAEAERFYKEYNWGCGLGYLWYGLKTYGSGDFGALNPWDGRWR